MPDSDQKVIETDFDTKEQDGSGDGPQTSIEAAFADIQMEEQPFSVFEYIRKYRQGKINIQPDFQRNLVWNYEKKCSFIESILLNFPIPPIYLNQDIEGKLIVIDGLQRSSTLLDFYDSKFELSDLEALPKLNGKTFNTLLPSEQSKFEDKKLTVYVLKPSTPMLVIYDLFNRINTNGTPLNRQEIRNCIFIGKSTRLLKDLSEKDYFRKAIDNGISSTRMKDREAILRYISFRWFGYHDYAGNMSDYVENAMKKINQMEDAKIQEIISDFKKVMTISFYLFEKKNFRIPTEYTRGTINIAVLESVCYFISLHPEKKILDNEDKIRDNFYKLLDKEDYYNAVTFSTSNKQKVFDRFDLANKILKRNLND